MFGSNFFDSLTLFSDQPWFNINFYVEITFVGIITYLVFQKAYKPKTAKKDATAGVSDAEVEKRLAEWRPADLVPPSAGTVAPPVVQSLNGAKVSLQGDPKSYVNFITQNYAGLVGDKRVEADCKKVIMKYGVGSCGPRGFYGSIDVHIECEEQIAKFMGTETAILYSYDAATPVSVIPAFAKKGDLIMADAGVNFNIKTGLHLCKSNVVFFDHNDMDDLEAKLNEQMQRDKKKPPKPLNRRFIVVEGIYVNYGDIAPLDALVRLLCAVLIFECRPHAAVVWCKACQVAAK
jgi:serine palmitoyltransferase